MVNSGTVTEIMGCLFLVYLLLAFWVLKGSSHIHPADPDICEDGIPMEPTIIFGGTVYTMITSWI